MNADLQSFVREALARGIPRAAIAEQLRGAGWRPDEIESALAFFADVDFPVPVPRRRPYLSAREAFLYLVLFATLYTTAFNVGVVLFQLIEAWLPDPARRAIPLAAAGATRGAAAGLIIAFPIFLALSRAIGRSIATEPEKRASKIRKWLTYITLFIAAMVLIGDLTFLVQRLLSGELVARILLKVLAVFGIAATVFGHYLVELRRDEREGGPPPRELRVPPRLAAGVVIVVLLAGLILAGSPTRERRRTLDAQRIEDLRMLSGQIETYARRRLTLPASLDSVLTMPDAEWVHGRDPVTGAPYEYRAIDSLRYELCATFTTADSERVEGRADFWRHPAGRACFVFRVERWTPPIDNPVMPRPVESGP